MLSLFLVTLAVSQCWGKGLVQTLVDNPSESTLVSLVTQAGLATALSSDTFTVFAPNNDAFAKVPQETLNALNAHPDQLESLLKYHVVQGNVLSSQLHNEQQVTTLNGQKLRVNVYTHNNVITVEGKKVIQADTTTDNGVIHVVDEVIMPPSGNIVDIVAGDSRFSTLLSAVQQVPGLADALKADPLTVFAPTNDAFAAVDSAALQKILSNPEILKEVLTYHVVDQTLYSAGLYNREIAHTEDTHHDRLVIHVSSSGVTVGRHNAHVTQADIPATNGVVHVIDQVLIPTSVQYWLRTGHLIG